MKRTRLPRRTRLARGGPLRRRGRARFRGYERNEPYRQWVRQHGCLLAGQHECWGLIEFCHVTSRGAGDVDEGNGFPACSRGHAEQHRIGIKSFERRYGVELRRVAQELWDTYTGEWQ